MNFQEAAERIKSIDVGDIFMQLTKENETTLLDVLRSQLHRGESGDGLIETSDGNGYYGRSLTRKLKRLGGLTYAEYKNRKNPRAGYGQPDLFYSGEFYREMFIENFDKESFKIWSRDNKADALAIFGWETNWPPTHFHEPYGLEIFEYNEQSLQEVRGYYKVGIVDKLRKYFNGVQSV
jgi:hypothetical protein